ncbi:MAG: DUF1570 domain-containing protein [Planctomycetota bacterium]
MIKGSSMRRNALSILLLVAITLAPAALADTVYLTNGNTVSGTIRRPIADDNIEIETEAGLKTFTRDQVKHFRMPKHDAYGKPVLGPDGKPVMADMIFKPKPLEMPFTVKTDHYVVKTDISDRVAQNTARAMEHLYEEYVKVFRPKKGEAAKKADVVIFEKQEDFLAYAKQIHVKPRKDTLGFFRARSDDGGEIVTYKRQAGETHTMQTLYHEATHQFVLMMTGVNNPPPLWVNEGLAVYFETSQWRGGKLKTGLIPRARLLQLQKAIRDEKLIHLRDLVQRRHDTFDALCYAESWALVYFFAKANNGRYSERFSNYFRALKAGVKHDEAFNKHLTNDFGKLERAWKQFVLSLTPPPAT